MSSAVEVVIAGTAPQHVVLGVALDGVISRAAMEGVVSGAACERVVAGAAIEGVAAAQSADHVVARGAIERVGCVGADDGAACGADHDRHLGGGASVERVADLIGQRVRASGRRGGIVDDCSTVAGLGDGSCAGAGLAGDRQRCGIEVVVGVVVVAQHIEDRCVGRVDPCPALALASGCRVATDAGIGAGAAAVWSAVVEEVLILRRGPVAIARSAAAVRRVCGVRRGRVCPSTRWCRHRRGVHRC